MIPIPQSLLHVPDGASFATLMSMAANHSNHVPVPAPRSVIRELDAFISRLSGFPVWKAIVDEAARFKDSLVTADDSTGPPPPPPVPIYEALDNLHADMQDLRARQDRKIRKLRRQVRKLSRRLEIRERVEVAVAAARTSAVAAAKRVEIPEREQTRTDVSSGGSIPLTYSQGRFAYAAPY